MSEDSLDSGSERRILPLQAGQLRSAHSITSVRSTSPQQRLGISPPRPTLSVDLTNHFTRPLTDQLSSESEIGTLDMLSVQDELASSMNSLSFAPLRELPNPFRTSIEDQSEEQQGPLPQGKQFFILTSAGKQIYTMHGEDEYVMGLMGIVHTLVSYFQVRNGSHEELRSITTYDNNGVLQKFAFMRKKYIVLLVMTNHNESDQDLQQQLDLLYSHLVSTLSQRQLNRLFGKRENFDLRNFLSESDFHSLDQLCRAMCQGSHPGWWLGALECVTMDSSVRNRIHSIMLHSTKDLAPGTLLYGLIVAPGQRLVSVMRPRGHTLHTTDLQLLFSMVENQLQLLDSQQEAWVPICFPKFNSNGFLYYYVKFLPEDASNSANIIEGDNAVRPALILISPRTNKFYELREAASSMIDALGSARLLPYIHNPSRITINDIPAPLAHHFIYKSKKYVQYVMPETIGINTNWQTLMTYYAHLKASVRNDNGHTLNQTALSFLRWSSNSNEPLLHNSPDIRFSATGNVSGACLLEEELDMIGLTWITANFELYLICNNCTLDRKIVLKSARNIVSWCKRKERKLFVSEGAVF
ncbi:HCL344Wp [Eremothecium sinecaudum]|uniref:Vacuolar fusion protein MON1 n=1 Tax=Eremothecium sinecaudum TaxID=45286 RepID=A0A109UZ42_9SACH|nr:HCL344Wp [Eremothecium sinecaudum]AMD19807.1 HCL344Wp [Eremothecium sinecaudum]